MKRSVLTTVAVAASLIASLLITTGLSASATTAEPALSVRVSGASLVDSSGQPIKILGVNRSGTEYPCVHGWGIFGSPSDEAALASVATWKGNAVRVPLNESCWLGINGVSERWGGVNYRTAIKDYVTRLHGAGFLVVLDLHWSAPGTTLATKQTVMANADHSPDFWRSVATTFKSDPAVIFDAFNEPHLIDWTCWRNGCTTSEGWKAVGMQTLVNAIRSTGAMQPIMLSGRHWGGDLSKWLEYAPVDPAGQLVAGAHIYNFSSCNTVACWDATIAPVAAKVPVVTGELGTTECSAAFVDSYMDWADARGVSYIPWTWNTWDCKSGPSLITAYDGTPTPYGSAVKQRFEAWAAASTAGVATAPDAPRSVTAKAGKRSATVSWTHGADGGSPLTGQTVRVYRGTSIVGAVAVSPTAASVRIRPLTAGVEYRFSVLATNSVGTSRESMTTNVVKPR